MGWGCYKHEWDAGSSDWMAYIENRCDERLKQKRKDWGRDGQICPKCWVELEAERDGLKALKAEMLLAMQDASQLVYEEAGDNPVLNEALVYLNAAIAKAEEKPCTTPK